MRTHEKSLSSYQETQRRLKDSDFIDMDQVISSVMWIMSQDKDTVGGRNFSTAHDPFYSDDFTKKLLFGIVVMEHPVLQLK